MEKVKLKHKNNIIRIAEEHGTNVAISRRFAKELLDNVDLSREVILDLDKVDSISRSFIDEVISLTNNKVKFINVQNHLKIFFKIEEDILGKKIKVEYK